MPVLAKVVEVQHGKQKRIAVNRDLVFHAGEAKVFNRESVNVGTVMIVEVQPRNEFTERTHDILASHWLVVEPTKLLKKIQPGFQLLQ